MTICLEILSGCSFSASFDGQKVCLRTIKAKKLFRLSRIFTEVTAEFHAVLPMNIPQRNAGKRRNDGRAFNFTDAKKKNQHSQRLHRN